MTPRRRRVSLLLAALLGLPALGAAAVFFWIHRMADERWAAAEERIRQLSAAFPEAGVRRAPETVSEAAKENQIHFVAAIRLAFPLRNRNDDAWNLVAAKKRGEAVTGLLEETQEFLDRVHEGSRRIVASPADVPPRWHGEWDPVTLQFMLHCGVLRARRQRETKTPFEGAQTLLDALQLARFWAISGPDSSRSQAIASISEVVDDLRDLILSESLTSEEFLQVERELELLDSFLELPLGDLEPTLARWGENLLNYDLREAGLMDSASLGWKYFLPQRLMKAAAFEFADRQVRQLLAAEGKGYPEVLRVGERAGIESEESGNPLVPRVGNLLNSLGWVEADRKTQLRLCRAAAHYRATGTLLDLADPFGDRLLHRPTATTMKFWSRGDDGNDDGGDGGGSDHDARDIVIDVPRRP
jgi:hypothetical protein